MDHETQQLLRLMLMDLVNGELLTSEEAMIAEKRYLDSAAEGKETVAGGTEAA